MAWIPLLLASWIVFDVVLVAIVLGIAHRRRLRERRTLRAAPELLLPRAGISWLAGVSAAGPRASQR
ncbi:MAG: hypothetical protein WC558_07015 [Patulibacter sp.]